MIPELEQFGVQFLRGRFRWRAPTCGLPVPVRGIGLRSLWRNRRCSSRGRKVVRDPGVIEGTGARGGATRQRAGGGRVRREHVGAVIELP